MSDSRLLKLRAWFYHPCVELVNHEWKGRWLMGEVLSYHTEKQKVRVRPRIVEEIGGRPSTYDVEIGEKCKIMQFIGLHDKNGREIYEGDILGDIYEGCYIGWCDECKQIQLRTPDECMACLGNVHWYELVEQDGKLEVIGNIWENPELLSQ